MGSPCLFTRQRALEMGCFYWFRVESSNNLHAELNLGYLKGTKFCLESKASSIDISIIASFKQFLIAWCGNIALFRTVSWLIWSPRVRQNTPSWELFSKNKSCSTIKLFFLFKYVLHYTVLSKYLKKKIGGHHAHLREKENLFRYQA